MSKSIAILISGAVAASLLSSAALALNPQPEPPSKRVMKQNKSLGGPDTKAFKPGKGGGAAEKGIILQNPGKGGRAGEKGIILQNQGK